MSPFPGLGTYLHIYISTLFLTSTPMDLKCSYPDKIPQTWEGTAGLSFLFENDRKCCGSCYVLAEVRILCYFSANILAMSTSFSTFLHFLVGPACFYPGWRCKSNDANDATELFLQIVRSNIILKCADFEFTKVWLQYHWTEMILFSIILLDIGFSVEAWYSGPRCSSFTGTNWSFFKLALTLAWRVILMFDAPATTIASINIIKYHEYFHILIDEYIFFLHYCILFGILRISCLQFLYILCFLFLLATWQIWI